MSTSTVDHRFTISDYYYAPDDSQQHPQSQHPQRPPLSSSSPPTSFTARVPGTATTAPLASFTQAAAPAQATARTAAQPTTLPPGAHAPLPPPPPSRTLSHTATLSAAQTPQASQTSLVTPPQSKRNSAQSAQSFHSANSRPLPSIPQSLSHPSSLASRSQSPQSAQSTISPFPYSPVHVVGGHASPTAATSPLATAVTSPTTPSSSKPSPMDKGGAVRYLGPGPEPQHSPDGHPATLPDEYVPDLTYPPRATPGQRPGQAGYFDPRSQLSRGPSSLSTTSGNPLFAHSQSSDQRPLPQRGLSTGSAYASPSRYATPNAQRDSRSEFETPLNAPTSLPTGESPSSSFETANVGQRGFLNNEKMTRAQQSSPQRPHRRSCHDVLHMFIPPTWSSRMLVLVVLLETVVNISIQANILWRFDAAADAQSIDTDQKKVARLPVYLAIFVMAHFVQLSVTLYAVKTRNTIQIIGMALFNLLLLVYACIEIGEIRTILGQDTPDANSETKHKIFTLPLNILTAVAIGVIAASQVAITSLTWFVAKSFGWDVYRTLGADLRIRQCYLHYQVFETLSVLSTFFFLGFGIQFLWLVLTKTDPEYIVTWVMLPLSALWMMFGAIAVRFEWLYAMAAYMVGLAGGVAYFVYKLTRIWTTTEYTDDNVPFNPYEGVNKSMTIFSAFCLLMIILDFAWGLLCWRNFGKGLKQSLANRNKPNTVDLDLATNQTSSSSHGPRLTID